MSSRASASSSNGRTFDGVIGRWIDVSTTIALSTVDLGHDDVSDEELLTFADFDISLTDTGENTLHASENG